MLLWTIQKIVSKKEIIEISQMDIQKHQQFINSTSQPGLPYFATIFLMPYDENFRTLKKPISLIKALQWFPNHFQVVKRKKKFALYKPNMISTTDLLFNKDMKKFKK